MTVDYVKKVLMARVYDVVNETPLEFAPALSLQTGNRIYLKREDRQSGYSFKLRGAYNEMASLMPEQLRRGVIRASAGNHAQGVAMSAVRLGCQATIVLPTMAFCGLTRLSQAGPQVLFNRVEPLYRSSTVHAA